MSKQRISIKSTHEAGSLDLGGEKIAYRVVRSARRKRTITLSVEADASLRIAVPRRAGLLEIEDIVRRRESWIVGKLGHLRAARPPEPEGGRFADGATIYYAGYPCQLRVTREGGTPQGCRVLSRRVFINIHDPWLSPENLAEEVRLEIRLWMRRRAEIKFRRRLDLWAGRLGVSYRQLLVSDPEKRWGSCSADNVIRLNWRLVMAPLALLDYVVAHELCHVVHKDHSPRFWGMLAAAMPDCMARRAVLRRNNFRYAL